MPDNQSKIKAIAEELRNQLLEYEDFVGLYLYGSQVKGTSNPDSDIDIAAIFNSDRTYDRSIGAKVYDLILKYDVMIDFHRVTPDYLILDYIYAREIKKGLYYAR
jgi:predicted nucleotidyltransferase